MENNITLEEVKNLFEYKSIEYLIDAFNKEIYNVLFHKTSKLSGEGFNIDSGLIKDSITDTHSTLVIKIGYLSSRKKLLIFNEEILFDNMDCLKMSLSQFYSTIIRHAMYDQKMITPNIVSIPIRDLCRYGITEELLKEIRDAK